MRKLDLSVERQHLLDNQRLKIPVSGGISSKQWDLFSFQVTLIYSLPTRIILMAALCDADNPIFTDYFFHIFFLSIQFNRTTHR